MRFGSAPSSNNLATRLLSANDLPVPGPATTRLKRACDEAIRYAGEFRSRSWSHGIQNTSGRRYTAKLCCRRNLPAASTDCSSLSLLLIRPWHCGSYGSRRRFRADGRTRKLLYECPHPLARNELIQRIGAEENTCRSKAVCRSIQKTFTRQRSVATTNYSGQKNSLSSPGLTFMRRSQALVHFTPQKRTNSETPRYVRFVPQSRPNAPQYTLSACASSVDGTSRPTAFTVSKLPMRSNSQTRPRVSPSGACRSPRVPSL
jgi:hypothetical protein